MKRVFLAINFNDCVFINEYISELKSNLRAENIKWVEPKNAHLTLKFFGPTTNVQLQLIENTLETNLKNKQSFSLVFDKLGIFGSKYQPRLLWMGMENSDDILKLQNEIMLALEGIDIESGRQNFVPHLTIGRIKNLQSKKYFQSVIDHYKIFASPPILINRIFLYESILRKEGPEYRVLKEFVLR